MYQVGEEKFNNKMMAVLKASEKKLPIRWIFHDEVWDNFSKNNLHLLGKHSLDYLYAQRAKQLRETYDYLILHYSGGSDSHNILMTFLNNDIPIDEIFVRRSEKVDSKMYTPNCIDTSAKNIFSEWDYVIKPQLDWIKNNRPNIKITLGDQFSIDPTTIYNDNTMIDRFGQFTGWVEMGRSSLIVESDRKLTDQGKRVANIYGIDKPMVIIKDKKFYMFFTDNAVDAANKTSGSGNSELFYYAKDMPILIFEQAYSMYKYFSLNKSMRYLIDLNLIKRNDHTRLKTVFELTKQIIYSTWDSNKFQTDKPTPISYEVRSRDLYYHMHPELSKIREIYNYYIHPWITQVNNTDHFDLTNQTAKTSISKLHFIGNMYD
jgi:hypothetical protein